MKNFKITFCFLALFYATRLTAFFDDVEVDGGYAFGKGPDIQHAYGFVGLHLYPYLKPCEIVPVFEGDLLFVPNVGWAFNLGGGGRYLDADGNFAFGLNSFFDYYNRDDDDLNQVSVGGEFLTCFFELHANYYLPVGRRSFRKFCRVENFEGGFEAVVWKAHYLFQGFDIEMGKTFLTPFGLECYFGIGSYYLSASSFHNTWGIETRARFDWNFLLAELRYFYDEIYGSTYRTTIGIEIPLGSWCCPNRCEPCYPWSNRPILRYKFPFTKCCCEYETNF